MSDSESNNPFAAFESDRTVIKPSAGRARGTATATSAAPAAATAASASASGHLGSDSATVLEAELPPFASLNPLVQVAAPLLGAAPRLRATLRHSNPAALRVALVHAIQRFETMARAQASAFAASCNPVAGRLLRARHADGVQVDRPKTGLRGVGVTSPRRFVAVLLAFRGYPRADAPPRR